jgi:hypothetical protein
MEQLRGLGHVLLASLLSLALCALLSYVSLVVAGVLADWPVKNWTAALVIPAMIVLWGLVIALPIIVVLAAPAYALLLHRGRASFVAAAVVGVIPGTLHASVFPSSRHTFHGHWVSGWPGNSLVLPGEP